MKYVIKNKVHRVILADLGNWTIDFYVKNYKLDSSFYYFKFKKEILN